MYVSDIHDKDTELSDNSWNFPLTVLFLREVGKRLETLGLSIIIVVYMNLDSTRGKENIKKEGKKENRLWRRIRWHL